MIDAATEASRRGHHTFFVAPRPRRAFVSAGEQPPVLDVLAMADADQRVVRVSVDVGGRFEFGTFPYRASVLRTALRRLVPHGTMIIPSDDAASWAASCSAGANYPVIGVLHADDDHYYALAEQFQRHVAAFVCVSARIEGKLRRRLGTLDVPVRRIPCGIPLGSPAPTTEGSPSNGRLVWAGRIEERQKRVSDLPAILAKLLAEDVDASLELIGDGPDRRALEDGFASRGLSERVRWTGWLSDLGVRQRMGQASVFLLPSNFEGMPVAAMEALAMGCGVAASQASGLEELVSCVEARDCLRTFPVGDVNGAVVAVRSLLLIDPASRAGAARALAAAEFSIERCLSRYEELEPLVERDRGAIVVSPTQGQLAGLISFPISAIRQARVWGSQLFRSIGSRGRRGAIVATSWGGHRA